MDTPPAVTAPPEKKKPASVWQEPGRTPEQLAQQRRMIDRAAELLANAPVTSARATPAAATSRAKAGGSEPTADLFSESNAEGETP